MLTLIVAASENNVIGKNNTLLWHLPEDFKRFKKLTTGHNIIMGRKTFDSLPGVLPNRNHIIISRKRDLVIENCAVINSLKNAIRLAYAHDEKPFVIGGGEIYAKAIEIADKLEVTRVHTTIEFQNFETTLFYDVTLIYFEVAAISSASFLIFSLAIMPSSTRLFFLRPSAVLLSYFGNVSPCQFTVKLF